jgi:hypothetical protein
LISVQSELLQLSTEQQKSADLIPKRDISVSPASTEECVLAIAMAKRAGWGYQVEVAANGLDALEKIAQWLAGELQTADVHPLPNTPSKAFTPPQKGKKCNPCVRYDLSPMSRVAHARCLWLQRNNIRQRSPLWPRNHGSASLAVPLPPLDRSIDLHEVITAVFLHVIYGRHSDPVAQKRPLFRDDDDTYSSAFVVFVEIHAG